MVYNKSITSYFLTMSRAQKRIQKDIADIYKSIKDLKDNGVYVHVNDENMNEVYTMFVGQEKTPYHHGFYFIKFTYPADYPMSPPKAFYCTQGTISGAGQIRFNPNLYTCGKVCLSMLNTWQGPGWVPTNTIMNVFMAIQALVLNETPLHNEPGYASLPAKDIAIQSYNKLISYANFNIGILEMMVRPPRGFEMFIPIMEEYFVTHFDGIIQNAMIAKDNSPEIKTSAYGVVHIKPNYDQTIQKLQERYQTLSSKNTHSATPGGDGAAAAAAAQVSHLGDSAEDLANALAIAQLLDEDDQNS